MSQQTDPDILKRLRDLEASAMTAYGALILIFTSVVIAVLIVMFLIGSGSMCFGGGESTPIRCVVLAEQPEGERTPER